MMPEGWQDQIVITSWNSAVREYKLTVLTPSGEPSQASMLIEGNTRKILFYRPFHNRLIRTEIISENISSSEYRTRCECADEGRTWTFSEANSKKIE
jgi:hypothetical protein